MTSRLELAALTAAVLVAVACVVIVTVDYFSHIIAGALVAAGL